MSNPDQYPVAVIEDRYAGTYSGGRWLAISQANKLENGAFRIVRCLEMGPHGDDGDAMEFWADPPDWIAAGQTPDEAICKLQESGAK
jgi:hypothetical protein